MYNKKYYKEELHCSTFLIWISTALAVRPHKNILFLNYEARLNSKKSHANFYFIDYRFLNDEKSNSHLV